MLKKAALVLTMGFALGGMSVWDARAIEYQAKVGAAMYSWQEQIGGLTPKELGPALTLGGYIKGFPSSANPGLSLRSDAEMFLAHVNYDTYESFTNAPVTLHTNYLGLTYEASAGWRSSDSPNAIEPFIGYGLRWWLRSIQSSDTVSGYPEQYTIIYNRIGLRGGREIRGHTVLHGSVSLDPMLFAREQVDFTSFPSGDTFTVKNGLRPGWTVELGMRGETVDGTISWRATRFGPSNTVSCLQGTAQCHQPESRQDMIGLTLGIFF